MPALTNSVSPAKNVPINGPKGPTTAMMLSVDINDPLTAQAFVSEVAEHFKVQRMIAPPDTSMLLITVLGDYTAAQFAARWRTLEGWDPTLHAFMALMIVADVVHGTPDGKVLEQVSLMDPVQ